MDAHTGSVPIGAIDELREDDRGLYVRAKLFDNPTVEPIRQAIAGGAIDGMSFRFRVNRDKWDTRAGDVDLRTIREVELYELGPVVFPAYDATTVGVRSLLAGLDDAERRTLVRELADMLRTPVEAAPEGTSTPPAAPASGHPDGLALAHQRQRYLDMQKEPA
jgi:HK97 family phage prohead protease